MKTAIQSVHAREVLDSRGNPTVCAEVLLAGGAFGKALVPSGASVGTYEATELRDLNLNRYGGKGVQHAVGNVEKILGPCVHGLDAVEQATIDQRMIEHDDSDNKQKLGANSMLAVSLAVARAAAVALEKPLYVHINDLHTPRVAMVLPVPMINVLNGGQQAHTNLDFQEFMIFPLGAARFADAIRFGAETYHLLKALLEERGFITSVGDTGGFAPNLESNSEAVSLIMESIRAAGYSPGVDIAICLNAAATSFSFKSHYNLARSNRGAVSGRTLANSYIELMKEYPIVSIEDPFGENDALIWEEFTKEFGEKIQIVGDDLFVTNPDILARGINSKMANATLIKPNQVGTLTETLETIRLAQEAGYGVIVSARSGDTEDTFIADLAVGVGAGQIKTGSMARSERVAKYNRLLEIEAEIENPVFGAKQFRFRKGVHPRKI